MPRRIVASRSGRADIAWFLFSVLFATSALGWACWSADWYAARFESAYRLWLGPAPSLDLPAWVAKSIMTIMLFLAYEFAYWLDHYLSHRIGWLWEFHKVHHTAESLTPLTNFRVHPIDTIIFFNIAAFIGGLTMAIVNHVLGGGARDYMLYGLNALTFLATILFTYLQHTHLWISFSGRAGYWFLSPAHHQIHHSVAARHHDRNFGSTLAVFDRLFGTLYIPAAKRETLRFGIDGIAYDPHSAQGSVVQPFIDAAGRFAPDRADHAPPVGSAATGLL